MPERNDNHATVVSRSFTRRLLVVAVAAILGGWPGPAVAQEATPSVAADLTETCVSLLADAVPTATISGEVAAPAFDAIPFDLLAIDTLTTHDEAVVALLTVALSGGQEPELRQFVESSLTEFRSDATTLANARSSAFPEASMVPIEFQTAFLDQALAAAGVPAGSGEAPLVDPVHAAGFLCTAGESVPFDLAVIDLLSAELQNGVAVGLLATRQGDDPALVAHGQAIVDRETTMIGQLAIWRDAWFGPGTPLVVAPTDGGHEYAAPSV